MHTDVICRLINYPPEVVGEGRGLGACWLCHDDIFLIPPPPPPEDSVVTVMIHFHWQL